MNKYEFLDRLRVCEGVFVVKSDIRASLRRNQYGRGPQLSEFWVRTRPTALGHTLRVVHGRDIHQWYSTYHSSSILIPDPCMWNVISKCQFNSHWNLSKSSHIIHGVRFKFVDRIDMGITIFIYRTFCWNKIMPIQDQKCKN